MSTTDLTDARDTTLQLRDGRILAYADYGASGGEALLYFHGGADSRLEARLLAEQAHHAGIRLIGIDRPGMGRFRFQASRRLLDWPNDVAELADHLSLDHFAVVGVSGGGPYALACAYSIPDRLTACGIIAGEWHDSHSLSFLTKFLPWLLIPIVGHFFRDEEHARKALRQFTKSWPEPDRKSLALPAISNLFAASIVEAFHQGARGPAYDGMVVRRPWGFEIEEIAVPRLYLWHGEQDKDVPVAMGRAIAERLAQCKATYYPNEGHLSLIVNHCEEIVATLMSSGAPLPSNE